MNVLLLTSDLKEKGGVGNYYRCLNLDTEPTIDYFFVNRIETSSIMAPNKKNNVLSLQKIINLVFLYLKFIVIAPKYQLIHLNPSLTRNSFYRDMVFIVIAKVYCKKVLLFYRGWSEAFEEKIVNSKILLYLFKSTFGRADAIIVLGDIFERKLNNMGVSPKDGIFKETTVADTRFLQGFDLEEKLASYNHHVNFLFISRILKEKGIYIAIDAFNQCQNSHTQRPMTFYIAGEGEELDNAKQYVHNQNIRNIIFLGNIKGEEKKKALHDCHIMIFPTYHGEGMPNSLLEGMLYGMPIISRVNAGIPDVVVEGKNGFLTTSLDSRVFANACDQLISNFTLYTKIAKTNNTYALSNFSTEKVRKRLLNIYAKLEASIR